MDRREIALKYFEQDNPYIKTRIESGIELYRKGDATITIKAENGELPENITVEAEQRSHAFKFGANLFMLDQFPTEEENAIYREKFPQLFNLATLPFYWSTLEPEMGKPRYAKDSPKIYRRPAPDLCIEYCKEKGIELILIKAPTNYFRYHWYYEWDAQIVDYAATHGLAYYNFMDEKEAIGLDMSKDTYDAGIHLNVYGAEKLTSYFGSILSAEHGMPDRRGEAETKALWDEKLRQYLAERDGTD